MWKQRRTIYYSAQSNPTHHPTYCEVPFMNIRRPRIERDEGDIDRKLKVQLDMLRASAKGFDGGDHWEALRISTVVQTLFHSRNQTVSLLRQLGLEDRRFLDSAVPFNPNNEISHCTLVTIVLSPNGEGHFFAELDDRPMRFITFDEWWNSPVLTTGAKDGEMLSRQQLTEIMRNQDGGAHVDPRIDAAYQGMRTAINFKRSDGQLSTQDGELFAMRQIGHEILKSLVPTYRRRPKRVHEGGLFRELYMQTEAPEERPKEGSYNYGDQAGRDLCHCGSQQPFRACHAVGYQDPEIFTSNTQYIVPPPGAKSARIALRMANDPEGTFMTGPLIRFTS